MWVATTAAIELPRTSPISSHHAPSAVPVGCVIGALREDERTRVFAAEESSLQRRARGLFSFCTGTTGQGTRSVLWRSRTQGVVTDIRAMPSRTQAAARQTLLPAGGPAPPKNRGYPTVHTHLTTPGTTSTACDASPPTTRTHSKRSLLHRRPQWMLHARVAPPSCGRAERARNRCS